jgi:solute carrier family 25 protein 34/35
MSWQGAMAACIAVTFTNPFEVVKVRRQLAEELTSSTSHFSVREIVRKEGVWSLQRGLSLAYGYQALMNSVRFGLYQPVSELLASNVAGGAIAGATGAIVASPLNLLKTRAQSYSPSLQAVMKSQYEPKPVIEAFRELYSKGRLRALWHGAPSAAMRTGIGSAVQLASYDAFKRGAGQDLAESWRLRTAGAMASGALTAVAMNPFDVVMTRMYNNDRQMYRTWWQCVTKLLRHEGPLALWRGILAHYVRVGPHTALTLLLVDALTGASNKR